jgi:RNA polymerase sigma factor (TIGR02999 family)
MADESRRPSGSTEEERREAATRALVGAGAGNRESLDQLVAELYVDLRIIAHRQLARERTDHTLSTTALVNEAYLKLAKLDRLQWQNHAHFCAEAARAMRRILVDYAVQRKAQKRGGDRVQVELQAWFTMSGEEAEQLVALNLALQAFEREWARQARVVECRFFGGMTIPDIAEALGISQATVSRDWELARAWLNRQLG